MEELAQLRTEFPQYQFICPAATVDIEAKIPNLSNITILFSRQLDADQLEQMPRLRWIHCPDPQLSELPLDALNEATQVVVTNTRGENLQQVREYVLAGVMAWAKQLFFWSEEMGQERQLWNRCPAGQPWLLNEKTFLQVGLGMVGSAITQGAHGLGMRVWGCDQRGSFHPHCDQVYPWKDLHSLLPAADVISICLPRGRQYEGVFGEREFSLLKDDSVLVSVCSGSALDEGALVAAAPRLRGLVLDTFSSSPLRKTSPLWRLPNALLTPEVSESPERDQREAYRSFRLNLRQFMHRNILDMQNVVERPFEDSIE